MRRSRDKHRRRGARAAAGCIAGLICVATTDYAVAADFRALELPGSRLVALSGDGQVAAGSLSGPAGGFRWTQRRGVEVLAGAVSVRGLSASGRYVAGSALDHEQREVAGYWDEQGAFHALGGLPGSTAPHGMLSVALTVTDEPRVGGIAYDAQDRPAAFVWTARTGMRRLCEAAPCATAAPASTVPSYGPPAPAAGPAAAAFALLAQDRAFPPAVAHAAIVALPEPHRALGASADEGVVVGSAGEGSERVAVLWTRTGGLRAFQDALAAQGVAMPGWTLMAATASSGDGRRIGGWGQHDGRFDSFIVEWPPTAQPGARAAD